MKKLASAFLNYRDLLTRVPVFVLVLVVLQACKDKPIHLEGPTMGTHYSIKAEPDIKVDHALLQQEVDELLKEINRQMSTYLSSSEIGRVNHTYEDKPMYISSWFAQVLNYSLELAQDTQGFFDPTVGPLVNLWGFGPGVRKTKAPSQNEIKAVLKYVGYNRVRLKPADNEKWLLEKTDRRVRLDLSATAKGFAVDKVSELLTLKGLVNHLVEIGGEIKVRGIKASGEPWVVAIEKPVQGQRGGIQLKFPLKDYSIATSGSYRNFFEEGDKFYSHTINTRTGRPVPHGLLSVTVLDSSCMKADGLATALMAMGPKLGLQYAEKSNIAAYFIIAPSVAKKPATKEDAGEEEAEADVQLLTRATKRFTELSGGVLKKAAQNP